MKHTEDKLQKVVKLMILDSTISTLDQHIGRYQVALEDAKTMPDYAQGRLPPGFLEDFMKATQAKIDALISFRAEVFRSVEWKGHND